jgi:hypothetical protein
MTDASPAPVEAPGLLARVLGVIFSPRSTFERLLPSPRLFGTILLSGVVIGLSQAVPQMTESGRQAAIDAAAQQMERFTGRPATEQQYANMQRSAPIRAWATMAFAPLGVAVSVLFFTTIYFIGFNVILGGTATFKQAAAVVAHGSVIAALGALAGAPVQYLQGTASPMGPFTLGALLPMLDEASFLSRFLGFIGVFSIWGTIVNAIGFSVLYRRKTGSIFLGLFTLTLLFAAVAATVMGFFSGR